MNKMETIIYCLGKTPIEHCLNCPHYMELNKSVESCRADRVAEANEIVKKYQRIQHIVRYDWGKGYQHSETISRIKEVMDEEVAQSFKKDVEAVKDQLPCGQMMDFPNTFDEFAKDYGFKDKEEVYTNGSELIPVFRVKQWLEHIATTKNDLGVDCVSRKEVFETIDDCNSDGLKGIFCSYDDGERFKEYIKNLPSVTPQEPKTGHWISRWYAGHDFRFHVCSECNEEFSCDMETGISIDNYRYCPNCGAKMAESEEV